MANAPTVANRLTQIRCLEKDGEFFRAYDLALQGLQEFPDDPLLSHRAVLNLCNAGALSLARRRFDEWGLGQREDSECLALDGRLFKSAAFRAVGHQRLELLRAAARRYGEAYLRASAAHLPECYYPGINLASVQLLSGERASAQRVAREVLARVQPLLAAADLDQRPDAYWLHATAIEAWLVLGDIPRAQALVPPALHANDRRYSDLASTVRQLRRVLAAQGLPETALGEFSPPAVIHYTGHMLAREGDGGRIDPAQEPALAAAIARELDALPVGSGYGSLAAGADLLFAEALLQRGAGLNVVLPFACEDFVALSVRPYGEAWVGRFERCLAHADTVRIATEGEHPGDDALLAFGSQLAMGLAVLGARLLCAPARQLAIWDGRPARGQAGTAVDLARWYGLGLAQTIIPCGRDRAVELSQLALPAWSRAGRGVRALLFADVRGFSKLSDAQIPVFADTVLGGLGQVLDSFGQQLAFANSWGDALFAVFDDVGSAARCALALQAAMADLDLVGVGLPATLALRIGGHLGPVFEVHDAILRRPAYMGAHVTRAARIEPVTPEGCVYVTESFAAVLALEAPDAFACDYVGLTEAAKQYGAMRMFLLHANEVEST